VSGIKINPSAKIASTIMATIKSKFMAFSPFS
jgi:hypothetical protein